MPGSQDYFGSISDTRDRRHYSRQITALNYIKLDEGNGGILLNVSEDGLAFTAAEPLSGDFVPRLRFQLADKAEWIEASGRIVWLNDSKKGPAPVRSNFRCSSATGRAMDRVQDAFVRESGSDRHFS